MIHPPVYLQTLPLPVSIRAMITRICDESAGEYFVISLSERLSPEEAKQAFNHEVYHIINGDFETMLTADRLEFQTLIRNEADMLPQDTRSYVTLINDPFRDEVAV